MYSGLLMCGIGGIAGPVPAGEIRSRLSDMVGAMRHRGPDDSGLDVEPAGSGAIGLCAARLAIQDFSSAGHQPMVSPHTRNCVAFNGELYNVHDLRRELAGLGRTFRGSSDTEVVLAAYDEWGRDCLARLRGMFGMAIRDHASGRLLLVRD